MVPLAFSNVAGLQPQLLELTRIQIGQDEKHRDLNDETMTLIEQYNDIVETIAKNFIHFDRALKIAEDKANPKKNLNE